VLLSHLAEVKERITHSSQTRIDTHIGTLGYILERHLLIKTHINHFALWSRQKVYQFLHITVLNDEKGLQIIIMLMYTRR
jgi:hypothetical protein